MSEDQKTGDAESGDTDITTGDTDTNTDTESGDAESTDAESIDEGGAASPDSAAAESPTHDDARAADAGQPGPLAVVRRHAAALLLAAALVASAGLAGWLYVDRYRPDQQTDAAAEQVALDAATSGTIALLSYSPESLDRDFAAAKARLTGDFLSYYTKFTEQIVTPAAREKSVKTAASVVRAAVSEMQPDTAEVLVFINQTTTSKENPDGAFAASSVKVGLQKIDGNWLIASFDPV